MTPKFTLWTLCKIVVGFLIIITFTPWVIPAGIHRPALFGIPYTLWVGIGITFLIVLLTWLGARVHHGRED